MGEGMKIGIPFSRRMAIAAIGGEKECTTRSSRYGVPGDTFPVEDPRSKYVHTFELTKVEPRTLVDVRDHLWKEEGFTSPGDFEEFWKKIHYNNYRGGRIYFVHWFRPYTTVI